MINKKYFCSNCKGKRNHKILFEEKRSGDEDFQAFFWINEYKVIECSGCENISFFQLYGDSSMIGQDIHGQSEYYYDEEIFPYYLNKGFELQNLYYLPKSISHIYKETINAFKVNSLLLAAGGFRAIIEALCNHLKIKKGNLEERINLLHSKGHLTLSESKRLHSIRFLGNDALHEIAIPKREQLDILLEIINHLLANLFINDKIITGQLDIVIDEYEDFASLIQTKIKKDMLDKEINLYDLIGKSKRLISKNNLARFEKGLVDDIKNGNFLFIEIVDEEKLLFRVIKEPELSFFW